MSFRMTPTDQLEASDAYRRRSTRRFRGSTHLIPSPTSQDSNPHKAYEPLIMKLPVVIGTPLLMLGLGIGLEVALFISCNDDGFTVPHWIFGYQFVVSFFPTLLILPFAIMWRELDWNLRWYQPYVVLQKGNAVAEESLLLDYISLGAVYSIFRAVHYKHHVIFWSSFTAILTYLFQPLTASILQIQQTQKTENRTVTATTGLISAPDTADISDLSGFMAAAGYVDASVIHGLADPPFVQGNWATAEVNFPITSSFNATLNVTTDGVQSNANCAYPLEEPVVTSAGTSFDLSSKSADGCQHNWTFNSSVLQYGVDAVQCPGTLEVGVEFRPVMFWYYNYSGSQEVKTVWCSPSIKLAKVQIVANVSNGGLVSCKKIGDVMKPNDLAQGLNGLIFDFSDGVTNNSITQFRAAAIKSIIPGAVLKAAQLNGSQSASDLSNVLLNWTNTLYTRHLSMSAKAIYFTGSNTSLDGDLVSHVPRLKVDEFAAHPLAFILVVTGIIGIYLHIIHRRARKRLLIATPPGSIASVVALTSRSGFGELLLPYDDERTLETKLDGLRFRLDRRTGAILAEDWVGDRSSEIASDPSFLEEEGEELVDVGRQESSTFLAYQAAQGTLPWQRSWTPAGMSPLQQYPPTEYVP